MTMSKFEIFVAKNGEHYFNLLAGNGQIILTSEGYKQTAGRDNGIQSVRNHSVDESNFEKKTTESGAYRFNLKASNGQVIGTSQSYKDEGGRDNGIASVMKNAPTAEVIERK